MFVLPLCFVVRGEYVSSKDIAKKEMISLAVQNIRFLGIGMGVLIAIAGTIGNFLAIAAYFTNKRIQTPFNLLVVNLAMVDFIASTTITPITIYGYHKMEWPFSNQACVAFGYFYFSTHYTSAVLLVIISINRFCHVSHRHATYTRLFSGRRRCVVGPMLWMFSPLFLLPLIFTNGFGWWEDGLLCTYTRKDRFNDVYSLLMRVLFQLIPLITIVFLYTLVFRSVKISHAKIDNLMAERCESVMMSTDTLATAVSPMQTPPRGSFNRTYTFGNTTPLNKSSPSTHKLHRSGRENESSSSKSDQESKSVEPTKSFTEIVSDYPIAVLERKATQTSFAAIHRINTKEKTESSEKSCDFVKDEIEILMKRRAATCSNIETPELHLSPSLQSIIGRSKQNLTQDTVRNYEVKRDKQVYSSPNRPRQLSVTPQYTGKASSYSSPFSRKANLSLPNVGHSYKRHASSPCVIETLSPPYEIKRKSSRRKSIQHAKAQRNLVYMCAIICSAFALCTLPSLLINLLGNYRNVSPEFHILTTILSWITSLVNPIVYAAMNMQFRKEYSRMFKRITGLLSSLKKRIVFKSDPQSKKDPPSIHINDEA